jgi:pentatricopeptide repeat protein
VCKIVSACTVKCATSFFQCAVHPLLRPSRLPKASLRPAASGTRNTANPTAADTGLAPISGNRAAQPTLGDHDHQNGRATGQLERAPVNGGARGAPRKLGAGDVSGEASEDIGSSLDQEEDVVGAWRAEIFGASKPAAAAGSGTVGGAPSRERGNLGGGRVAAGGMKRGASRTQSSFGSQEGIGTADGMGAGAAEDGEEALQRKTALAATLLGLDGQPADVSGASGPPAREVLAGLRNPPWKARSGGGGRGAKQETESPEAEGEGPVSDEGDRWRPERLQRHLANKARLNASRAAESSGRGGGKAREDMARVRKSRGLEGLGAKRKHSQLGDVTVARAAMFMQFNKEVHEAIKEALGRGGLGVSGEGLGDGSGVEGALPQGGVPDRVSMTGGETIAREAATTEGGLGPSERGKGTSEEERGPSGDEPAASAPSLLKSALAAISVSELRQVLAAHEAATSDVLDAEDGSMLVRELSWAGRADFADAVFRTLCASGNEPSARACHALIVAAHRKGDYRTVLRVFSMARVRGIVPNRMTCMAAIEACHRLGRWREARAIFSDMGRCGLEPDTLAYNALLMTLGAARETREVEAGWERMKAAGVRPNQQTYGLLISTLTKAGKVDDALEIYERLLKDGFQASAIIYEGLVVLLCRSKRDRMALNFYHEMRLSGHILSPRGHSVLLSALAKGWVLDWESALEVYTNMKLDGVPLEVHHLTSLLKVLALSRQTDTALEIWKEALAAGVEPDLACYNSVIGVLRVVCDYDRAMDFFWAMKDSGVQPDQETYGNLLWACSEPGLFKSALKLYEDMKRSGVAPNTHAFTALFTVMGRAGEWQTALELWKVRDAAVLVVPSFGRTSHMEK